MVTRKSNSPFHDPRILFKDFRRLKISDYEQCYPDMCQKEFETMPIVFQPNGNVVINQRSESKDLLGGVFVILMAQSAKTLKEAEQLYQNKYPDVHSISDVKKYENDDLAAVEITARFLIPKEFMRREMERQYYGKIKPFM